MTKTLFLGASFAAFFLIAALFVPGVVSAIGDYLFIDEAELKANSKKLKKLTIETEGDIPTVAGTLLGYGVLTNGDSLVVTTSHGGALDSIEQQNALDPIWHQHYVKLQGDTECTAGLAGSLSVADLSWTSPGKIKIKEDEAKLRNVPLGDIMTTSSLDVGGPDRVFSTGQLTDSVVAFELALGPSGQVCVIVTDLVSADD